MDRHIRQIRSVASEFNTREDGEALSIEGYFAVFNSTYNIMPGMSESVAPGAFTDTISGDVRALINHDTGLVLGHCGRMSVDSGDISTSIRMIRTR